MLATVFSADPPRVSRVMTWRVGTLIGSRGGPRHGPPHPPTLGRAPAEPWRASGLPQEVSLRLPHERAVRGLRHRARRALGTEAVVALPQLQVLDRVALDVRDLLRAHLADRLRRHAHHQPAGGHELTRRHQGAGADLRTVLDDGARQHDGADADAHVVADAAGVDDAPVADGDAVADDARQIGRDVEHRVVLHVGVAPDVDVIVLVTAHDRARPDRRALLDDDVADHLRGGIDPRAWMDPRRAAGHGPDHRRGSAATGSRAALTARLSAATTSGGRAAMSRAHAVASSISASGVTTDESRP